VAARAARGAVADPAAGRAWLGDDVIAAVPREPLGFKRDTPEDQREILETWCKENGAGYGVPHVAAAAGAGLLVGFLVAALVRR